MRIQLDRKYLTLEEADRLENWLHGLPQVRQASVHERTRCVILEYRGERCNLLETLSRFSFRRAPEPPVGSGRALRRTYEEKLAGLVIGRAARTVFLPAPLQAVWAAGSAVPYLFRAVRCVLRREMKVELLDGLSVSLSLLRGDFSTASSVVFLLKLGEILEGWTRKKSAEDLARSMALNVDRVWRLTPEGEVLTPLAQVSVGDPVRVRMGGIVPLDGVLEEGEVMVNQASLTGEPLPVPKRPGMMVHAGVVIEEGECLVRITQSSGNTRYDRVVAMIEHSEKLKSAAENRAVYLADHLVPVTLAGSALTWLLTRNTERALSVLMVDFSCALKLAMPLSVLSAMREAGGFRVTVKGGRCLESIAQADTVVFDKTGTLTHACPTVVQVVGFGGNEEDEMLRLAACLEEHFPHSMANAVVRAARERGLDHEEMHSEVEYLVAHGIASTVGGQRVTIGSYHFVFEDEGAVLPEGEESLFAALPDTCSHLYMAIGGTLAAVICVFDPLREEAAAVVHALRDLGVKRTVMLTGDSGRTAAAIAEKVGVDEYQAEMLPEDKARYIKEERKKGHTVLMLGDGINDSPGLSAADVGIAVRDGAAIAREIADVTISADSLDELVILRRLSAALMERIGSNYRFIVAFNGALIVLGALGILPPGTSALLHNASTLGISLRSMSSLLPEES